MSTITKISYIFVINTSLYMGDCKYLNQIIAYLTHQQLFKYINVEKTKFDRESSLPIQRTV